MTQHNLNTDIIRKQAEPEIDYGKYLSNVLEKFYTESNSKIAIKLTNHIVLIIYPNFKPRLPSPRPGNLHVSSPYDLTQCTNFSLKFTAKPF